MASFADNYRTNYDALTSTTKGSVTGQQLMWACIAATIFDEVQKWVRPDAQKMIHPPKETGN